VRASFAARLLHLVVRQRLAHSATRLCPAPPIAEAVLRPMEEFRRQRRRRDSPRAAPLECPNKGAPSSANHPARAHDITSQPFGEHRDQLRSALQMKTAHFGNLQASERFVCCISLFCGTRITATLDGPELVREQGRSCPRSSVFRERDLLQLTSFPSPTRHSHSGLVQPSRRSVRRTPRSAAGGAA
jgi:hypothetical protein